MTADTPLRFGVFIPPQHPLGENPTLLFERDLALIALCDRLGYDEAWVGEHHSGGFETIAAPELVIAAAAERTRHIRLGTGVRSLPYTHPLMVADTMVQLDHMTRGRAMFGVGPGALPIDAMQLGLDPGRSRDMMEDALEVIVPLLEGERVSAERGWFALRDAKLQIAPFTRPRMEMAVTTVRSPAGAMIAGRFGLGMLSLGGASDKALAAYAENWGICEEFAAKNGRRVDRAGFRIAVPMHLAETREQAVADLRFGFDQWVGYAREVLPFGPIPDDVDDPLSFVMESRRAIIGTPDDAIEAIEAMQKGSGGFGVFLSMEQDWADWAATDRSYELFARHVVPHFRGQLAGRRESYAHSARLKAGYKVAAEQGVQDAKARYERERGGAPDGKRGAAE
jgi:limonene 1,2-monooxygenase